MQITRHMMYSAYQLFPTKYIWHSSISYTFIHYVSCWSTKVLQICTTNTKEYWIWKCLKFHVSYFEEKLFLQYYIVSREYQYCCLKMFQVSYFEEKLFLQLHHYIFSREYTLYMKKIISMYFFINCIASSQHLIELLHDTYHNSNLRGVRFVIKQRGKQNTAHTLLSYFKIATTLTLTSANKTWTYV